MTNLCACSASVSEPKELEEQSKKVVCSTGAERHPCSNGREKEIGCRRRSSGKVLW